MAENPYALTPEEQLAYAAQDPAHPFIDPRVASVPVEFMLNPQKYGYRDLVDALGDVATKLGPQAASYILYNMSPGGVPVTAARNMAADWQNPYMPAYEKVARSAADLLGVGMMAAPTQMGQAAATVVDSLGRKVGTYTDELLPIMKNAAKSEVGAIGSRPVPGDTSSKQFKEWFGDSKVVDESGPMKVFHGTDKDFSEFNAGGRGIDSIGPHFGTPYQAESRLEWLARGNSASSGRGFRTEWPNDYAGFRTMPEYLSIKNPLELHDSGTWSGPSIATTMEIYPPKQLSKSQLAKAIEYGKSGTNDLKQYLKQLGYDGIKYNNTVEGSGLSWIPFDPEQIKSTFNQGTWSKTDPDIMRAVLPLAPVAVNMAGEQE